jgi:hypothetical protein
MMCHPGDLISFRQGVSQWVLRGRQKDWTILLAQGGPLMRMFDVQGIEIAAPRRKVFEFLCEPANLPRWAHAFVSAGNGRARLETPAGAVDVGLGVTADADTGVVDWRLAFPDGSVGIAQSRVTETTRGTCIYSFVLHAPPVALEHVEGALDAQGALLHSELATLKSLMEQ